MTYRYISIDPTRPNMSRKHDCVGSVSFTDLFDADSVEDAMVAVEQLKQRIAALPRDGRFHVNASEDGVWGFEVYVPSEDGAEWDHSLSYRSVSGGSVGF